MILTFALLALPTALAVHAPVAARLVAARPAVMRPAVVHPAVVRPAVRVVAAPAGVPARILAVHNRYRAAVGAKPLQWSPELAVAAGSHGPVLAKLGKLVHSARDGRRGQSENLWLGTRARYVVEAMVDYWADERHQTRAGMFPNISTTGNWQDVSHYTQMIWPATTHVGCHLESTWAHDILICRYSPKGNRDGIIVGR